jgi:hypothetical protein
LGEDYQGNIALTNNNAVAQSATIPSGTYAAPTATKSADFEADSGQYLTATHAISSEIDDLTALTGCCWINTESSAQLVIWEKGADFGNGHHLFLYDNLTALRGRFGTIWAAKYGGTFSLATWYFVALTYSQATDVITWYRGTEAAQVTAYSTTTAAVDQTASTAAGFAIGGRSNTSASSFDGLICEFAIFSEALSLAELQDLQQYGMDGSG